MASPVQGMKQFTCKTLKLIQYKKPVCTIFYRSIYTKTVEEHDTDDFRVLDLFPQRKMKERRFIPRPVVKPELQPRAKEMKTDQIWTDVWPAPATFKASTVPFPVRQGYPKKPYHMTPVKYGNTELLKIPNFLHLTPIHIKKHCAALKKFCNPWPSELDADNVHTHFPMEVVTQSFVMSAATPHNSKARIVTLKVKMSDLELDYHAKDKLKRLVGDRYNEETDILTIVTDRCPVKKQNEDYAMYLLTALYFEAWTTEAWESEKEETDWERHFWRKTVSKENIVSLLQKLRNIDEKCGFSSGSANVSYLPKEPSEDCIVDTPQVKKYGDSITRLFDEGENEETLENYRKSVLQLLNLNK